LSKEIGTDELLSSPAITERSEGGKTEVEGVTASDESAAEATTKKLSAILKKMENLTHNQTPTYSMEQS
jgi:hypothetical protein